MSTFLFTLLGLTVGTSNFCAMKQQIAPCTCRFEEPKLRRTVVTCEQMSSFANIADILSNRFPPNQDISLKINCSHLHDLNGRSFKELGMNISNLKLNFGDLRELSGSSFLGLDQVEYFSLADNRLTEIPRDVLRNMPKLKTLDMGRSKISNLFNEDFRDLSILQHLLLPENELTAIESDAFPKTVRRLHLGKNSLQNLNGSLRGLSNLEWLFLNENLLITLHEELPKEAPKLFLIHAARNHLSKIPIELINYPNIDTLFMSYNNITSLDGILKKSRSLKRLGLNNNRIHALAADDFDGLQSVEEVQIGYNYLKQLNKIFHPLKSLRLLNLTHNQLAEFSLDELRGLQNLKFVDLSHNKIANFTGRKNTTELATRVETLNLENNEIVSLRGSFRGILGLKILNLSHNKLTNIEQNDLNDLDDLVVLDISFNSLTTLSVTAETHLPNLKELIVNNNYLHSLENDFHGLPLLCKVDLSHNQIVSLTTDLIRKTRCRKDGLLSTLQINVNDNPVVCNTDFNITAEYMRRNFCLLKADFTVCHPPPEIATLPVIIHKLEMTAVHHSHIPKTALLLPPLVTDQ